MSNELQQLRSQNEQLGPDLQTVVTGMEQNDQFGQILQSLSNRVDDLAESVAD